MHRSRYLRLSVCYDASVFVCVCVCVCVCVHLYVNVRVYSGGKGGIHIIVLGERRAS